MTKPDRETIRFLILLAIGLMIEGTTLLEHVCPAMAH